MVVVASRLGRPCLALIALLASAKPVLSADEPRGAVVARPAPAATTGVVRSGVTPALARVKRQVQAGATEVAQKPEARAAVISASQENRAWAQSGTASWYGGIAWHGKLTASGARYDENILTAAHATLPIGTRVRVTLAGSTRSVIVVINDRPGTRTRIIDLSRAAARDLGILSRGLAQVVLTRVDT